MSIYGKTVARTYYFDSSSGSNTYETLQYTDGDTSCNCPGWTRRIAADGSRSCKHTRMVHAGMAETEAKNMVDYTKGAVKAEQTQIQKPKRKNRPKPIKPGEISLVSSRKIQM